MGQKCLRFDSDSSINNNLIMRDDGIVDRIRKEGFSLSNLLAILKNPGGGQKWPTNRQVDSALRSAGTKNAKLIQYILFKIEREVMTEIEYVDNPLQNFENLNREHVLPQGWERANGWEVNDCAKIVERNACLHSIGNLTLLKNCANAKKFKNHSFRRKKLLFRKYSTLKITEEIIKQNDWDVAQIKKRHCRMYQRFCQVWSDAQRFESEISGNGESEAMVESAQDEQRRRRGKLRNSFQSNHYYGSIECLDDQTELRVYRDHFRESFCSLEKGAIG